MNEDRVSGTAKNLAGGMRKRLLVTSLAIRKARLKGSSTRPAGTARGASVWCRQKRRPQMPPKRAPPPGAVDAEDVYPPYGSKNVLLYNG